MASSNLLLQMPCPQVVCSSVRVIPILSFNQQRLHNPSNVDFFHPRSRSRSRSRSRRRRGKGLRPLFVNNKADIQQELSKFDGEEDTESRTTTTSIDDDPSDSEVLEYVSQVKRVLELLKKNRDMMFGEVKLTIMIEDPRDVERRRLAGIDDENAPTRDDLAAVLEEIKEGKVSEDRIALRMLAEEMLSWPNLEVEASKKNRPSKSLYAKATDTGVNLKEAAKRLNIDWDSAAEIEETDDSDESDVPPVLGYGALYLVSAFPVIIGISVVLILFYNSLQ